jgi:hypothetical protein
MASKKQPNSEYSVLDNTSQEKEEVNEYENSQEEKDEEEDSYTKIDDDDEEEEYVPEAFIPSFTVAPDEIPIEQQTHLPTEEEKKSVLESLYAKLGISVKEALASPPQPITAEKEQFVTDTSQLLAKIVSAVSMWLYSIPGIEYSMLAPDEQQADAIVRPLMRVVARHSKVVANVSPDYLDLTSSIKAMSDYANHSMQLLMQIREIKLHGGQPYPTNPRETNAGFSSNGHNPVQGYSPNGENDSQIDGLAPPVDTRNFTDDERRNYESLRVLAARDYAYRARRSGRV